MASNGRLPASALAPITKATNGQPALLRKDAAATFMAMNAEAERRFGVTLRVSSARTAYRPLADQQYFWNLYISGRGNLAARPGTSNHGLGIAVDLATTRMRQIVDQIGQKYGWAKRWSDAPSEWWHVRWRAGAYAAAKPDPFAGYPADERRWLREFQTVKDPTRRRVLVRVMTRRRKVLWHLLRDSNHNQSLRQRRYDSLKVRT